MSAIDALIILFLQALCTCVNGLVIKIDAETIMKRPLLTPALAAGFGHLLLEGDYSTVAKLLRFKSFNLKVAYYITIKTSKYPFLLTIYDTFNNGFITNEDARVLLPSDLIASQSDMENLLAHELLKLPNHPFAGDQDYLPYHLNENTLIAALRRGIQERDPEMNWTAWLPVTPLRFDLVWYQPDLWRVFLLESFCDCHLAVKRKMLFALKHSIERIQFPSKASIDNLMMINVTLVAFYVELCRLHKAFNESNQVSGQYSESLLSLEEEFASVFKLIKDHRGTKGREDLFKGLDASSTLIVYNSGESLRNNPFYYEERIELFARILERLKGIPDLFADWFINFISIFDDVISKMSFKLLSCTWELYLSFKPSIRSISTFLQWFQNRIPEEYRFKFAKMIPIDLLVLIYKKCPKKHIPMPKALIPYDIRESEYLKTNRIGTNEAYVYSLTSFWTPEQANLVKLLKVFQLMKIGTIDLFESIDTLFILERGAKETGIRKFIEIVLEMFLSVKEWSIELSSVQKLSDNIDGKEIPHVPIIIPSPLFPPSFAPFLSQLIVRCRHLNCTCPFRIAENYLMLSQNYIASLDAPLRLTQFVQSLLNYLRRSDGSRLPKLTFMYQMYFSMITTTELEIDNISIISDDNEEELGKLFFKHHLSLYKAINYLKQSAQSEINRVLTPGQWSEIEEKLSVILSKTLESFGSEMFSLLNGPFVFNQDEIHSFLYN